jgi:hypothetical protein
VEKVTPYAKAIVGALIACLASVQQALDKDGHITSNEWVAIVIATLVAGGAVFAIPNRDPRGRCQAESVQSPEAGYGAVELLVGVLVVVILLVVLFRLV